MSVVVAAVDIKVRLAVDVLDVEGRLEVFVWVVVDIRVRLVVDVEGTLEADVSQSL